MNSGQDASCAAQHSLLAPVVVVSWLLYRERYLRWMRYFNYGKDLSMLHETPLGVNFGPDRQGRKPAGISCSRTYLATRMLAGWIGVEAWRKRADFEVVQQQAGGCRLPCIIPFDRAFGTLVAKLIDTATARAVK